MTLLGPQRERFQIPESVAYLNCAYMAPRLRAVTEAGTAAVVAGEHPWTFTTEDFFAPAERLRVLFARIVGADADGVALVPAVSYGMAVAAANVELGEGRRVVVLAEQFPSHVYPWRAAVDARGGEIVTVPAEARRSWTDGVLAAIDERTAVVAVPNVHWTDGSLLDLERVGTAARAVGAALVVDGTQSLGAMPFAVERIRPDFVVAAAYKWLLGPYSVGFLWAAPHRREGVPLEENWITREGAEDFSGLVAYRDAYQPGARRYDVGERSNFVLLPMAIAALEQIVSWEVESVAATIGRLTDRVERLAVEQGIGAVPAGRRGPHMIGLRPPGGLPEGVAARLAAAGVFVSVRGDAIRVSPHVYNDDRDIDRLFAVLDALG